MLTQGAYEEKTLVVIKEYILKATYKCERPSGENASECLSVLVDSPIAKKIVFENLLFHVVEFGTYMVGKGSLAKVYIL